MQRIIVSSVIIILLYGCTKEINISQPKISDDKNLVQILVQQGFNEQDITDGGNYFIVEGDIVFSKEGLRKGEYFKEGVPLEANNLSVIQRKYTVDVQQQNDLIEQPLNGKIGNIVGQIKDYKGINASITKISQRQAGKRILFGNYAFYIDQIQRQPNGRGGLIRVRIDKKSFGSTLFPLVEDAVKYALEEYNKVNMSLKFKYVMQTDADTTCDIVIVRENIWPNAGEGEYPSLGIPGPIIKIGLDFPNDLCKKYPQYCNNDQMIKYFNRRLIMHEIGHNVGLGHTKTITGFPVPGTPPDLPYDYDPYSIMLVEGDLWLDGYWDVYPDMPKISYYDQEALRYLFSNVNGIRAGVDINNSYPLSITFNPREYEWEHCPNVFTKCWTSPLDKDAISTPKISHNEIAGFTISGNRTSLGKTKMRFDYKVSSEKGYDFFKVYINGSLWMQKSGETGWQSTVIYLPSDNFTIKFVYEKDYSVSSGEDRVYIDWFYLI